MLPTLWGVFRQVKKWGLFLATLASPVCHALGKLSNILIHLVVFRGDRSDTGAAFVVVHALAEILSCLNLYVEFFSHFANQALLEGFAVFHPVTRKFPRVFHSLTGFALSDEHLVFPDENNPRHRLHVNYLRFDSADKDDGDSHVRTQSMFSLPSSVGTK